MSSASVIEFGSFNPRRNLPPAIARKRGESNFVAAFQRDFTAEHAGRGVGGRHFELVGYGIADFVWMDYGRNGKQARSTTAEPFLTAFEMKLKNWKRALSQAYRYSYFSDCAIVVLPEDAAERASAHLSDFQRLGVGLWSYDPKSECIGRHFTPAGTKAKHPVAREKALARISRKVNLRKVRE